MQRTHWPGGRQWGIRAAAWLGATAATAMLLGCGSSTTSGTQSSAASTAPVAAGAKVPVALHLNEGSYAVSSSATTISGTVTKGASVFIAGRSVGVHSGQWRDSLHLHIGSNPIEVAATMAGRSPGHTAIRITRHHSAAELEARAKARALRAEEQQHRETQASERKAQEARAARQRQKLAECTNGTYVNSSGNTVCKPVASSTQPAGATAECEDGTYSFSEHRSGTCSHHGGVKRWLNE
jgi:hypothetical protein